MAPASWRGVRDAKRFGHRIVIASPPVRQLPVIAELTVDDTIV